MIKWLYNDLKNGTPHFEYAKSVVKFRWILYEKYDFQKFCVNVFWEIQILSLELYIWIVIRLQVNHNKTPEKSIS